MEKQAVSQGILKLLLMAMLMSACNFQLVKSEPNTWIVDDDGPTVFREIQEAINHASVGDTIFVRDGIYHEQVIINKSISLIGSNKVTTIIETGPKSDAITIVANNVTLSGFTIRNTGTIAYSSGIRLINASHNIVQDNIITAKFIGIDIQNGSCNNVIQNNLIKNNNQYGVFIMRLSNGNIVRNNSILDNGWNGVELAYCEKNVIEANFIANNRGYGLEIPIYAASSNNVIFHNNFLNNSWDNPFGNHASDFLNNSWDFNGEGNFWDDYKGIDEDQDGIGDFAYFINCGMGREVADRYPLMGRFSAFMVHDHHVSVISSSTVKNLNFKIAYPWGELSLHIKEETPVGGFSRICIYRALLNSSYQVMIDDELINFPQVKTLSCINSSLLVYVSYLPGEHLIKISGLTEIPESPKFIWFLVFLIAFFIVCAKKFWRGILVFK